MKVVEEHAGAFLRLSLEGAEEIRRYRTAYDQACHSGLQVQQTSREPQTDGSHLVGIWLDARLAETFRRSIETGCDLETASDVQTDDAFVGRGL